jgi:predicted permease
MDFRELRHALQRLVRSPLFTTITVVTLALGIGANAAIFAVVNAVLLEPLPFDEPASLVGVWLTAPGLGFENVHQSPATYSTFREEASVFEDIGMWDDDFVAVTGTDEPERVEAIYVTDGTLPLLGVEPTLGRVFTAEDDAPSAPETAILGYGYWQSRFGGDDGVLGKTLTVDGIACEIIGVMPQGLRFLRFDPALWLPFRFDRSELYVGDFSYQALARLRAGVTLEQANAEVERLIPITVEKFPRGMTLEMLQDGKFGPNVRPLKRDVVGDIANVLWVVFGTVGLVLLIACANVANLFLVRSDGRQREIALRAALGASRARLAWESAIESLILGGLGAVTGLAMALGGIRLLVAVAPSTLPRSHGISVDTTVVAFTVVISLVASAMFGLLPVLGRRSHGSISALQEGGRASSEGPDRLRARSGLVVSQIALALVLLVGAGLMIRSFLALSTVHPGFVRPDEVLTLRISIPEVEAEGPERAARTHEQIVRRVEGMPGVDSVGISSSITMDGFNSADGVHIEDFPVRDGQLPNVHRFKWVGEGYFETMGNPVVAGRAITWRDVHEMANVAVVTENFATEYWSSPREAVGKRIRPSPDRAWREIVGVVGNVHDDGVSEEATSTVFWPMLQRELGSDGAETRRTMSYAVRTARLDTAALVDEIRTVVWSVNPNLPVANVRTLGEILDASMARTAFTLVMLAIASAFALVLGAVGIYGVISYAVSRRTREIGVRMALGARRSDVSRMVLRDGVVLTCIGVAIGLAAAAGLSRLMSALLYGVSPVDAVTYTVVSVALGAVALSASYLPARQAASVPPTEALRWE